MDGPKTNATRLAKDYGEAATMALKLYIGGLVEKLYPCGANLKTRDPPLVNELVTLQSPVNGRFTFEWPRGRSTDNQLSPHDRSNLASSVNRTTPQTKSSV